MIQQRIRHTADALRSGQSGLEMAERLHKQDPENAQYYELLGKGYYRSAKAMEDASAPDSRSRSLILYQQAQSCYEDLKKDQRLTDEGATLLSETTRALTRLQENRFSTHAE